MKSKKIISISALTVLLSSNAIIFSNANTLESTLGENYKINYFNANSSNYNQDKDFSPRTILLDQYVTFQGEGQTSFTYHGGKSLEVTLKNTGSSFFNWRIVDPKGKLFHTGTLAAGKSITSTYPDMDSPNGRYTIYIYNDSGQGQFKVYVRNIEY